MGNTTERPIVVASNRGPVSFDYDSERDQLLARRGGGGLVSGLAGLRDRSDTVWIAAAMNDADRLAHERGVDRDNGASLLALDPDDYEQYYDRISNELLWFAHHHLFDLTYEPGHGNSAHHAWEAYRRINQVFADEIAASAPPNAIVLVQDYHLSLVPALLSEQRDDVSIVHFHHTPFAAPAFLRALPDEMATQLLAGLAGADACGFHSQRWVDDFADSCESLGMTPPATFVAPLSVDPDALRQSAATIDVASEFARLDAAVGESAFIVRVDRIELSKNLLRGFAAFDAMLSTRSDLHGKVTFGAFCYPSRGGVPEYQRYRDRVEAAVAGINERYGTDDWTPILLETDDNYPRSLAALQRADVLVVNAVRDGLNLVAKEGAILGDRHPSLILSTETGAFQELADLVDAVNPFDISDTSAAMQVALSRSTDERAARGAALVERATARTPGDWLDDQLDAVS